MGSETALHTKRYKAFLIRLCLAREGAGLTQVQLAKAVWRSQTWVSKCELGERRGGLVELEDLAKALAKPLEWFRTK